MPRSPRSPILRHSPSGNWFDRSISAARGAISFAANCWTVARSMSMSSPSAKFSEGKFSMVLPSSAVCLAMHDDQCLLHQRNKGALVACLRVYFAAGDCEPPTRFNDMTFGQQALARRRGEQVQLEFDCQHGAVLRKQREPRVTACRIDDRADNAGMH